MKLATSINIQEQELGTYIQACGFENFILDPPVQREPVYSNTSLKVINVLSVLESMQEKILFSVCNKLFLLIYSKVLLYL